jgi:hypothetical protein
VKRWLTKAGHVHVIGFLGCPESTPRIHSSPIFVACRSDMGKARGARSHPWRHQLAIRHLGPCSTCTSLVLEDCSYWTVVAVEPKRSRHGASWETPFQYINYPFTIWTRYKAKLQTSGHQSFGTTLIIFTLLIKNSRVQPTHLGSSVVYSSEAPPKDQGWHCRPLSFHPIFY